MIWACTSMLTVDADTCSANCIMLFRCSTSAVTDPSMRASDHVSDAGRRSGALPAGLRQQRAVSIPTYLLRRLQSVRNTAAWLIFNLRCSTRITDVLVSGHWLRVPKHIQYKVAALAYSIWYGIVEFNVPLDIVQAISETGGPEQ